MSSLSGTPQSFRLSRLGLKMIVGLRLLPPDASAGSEDGVELTTLTGSIEILPDSIDLVYNATVTRFLKEADGVTGVPSLFTSVAVVEYDLIGQMAVWPDGGGAECPADSGDDGEALTGDDSTAELEPSWTLVDFFESPYRWSRGANEEITLARDLVSDVDFTGLGRKEALTALIDQLEDEYAVTDMKGIDFEELRETYQPVVEATEADEDLDAYNVALHQLALEFRDGHVSASRPKPWFTVNYGGSYGLHPRPGR